MTGPEDKAREHIDSLLEAAGWSVQHYKSANLGASLGAAVTYFPLKKQNEADYVLFIDRKAVGVLEAKKVETTLIGVAEQTKSYLSLLPDNIPSHSNPMPFAYESTGKITYFRDERDPEPRSRQLFAFHTPEELQTWLDQPTTTRYNLTQLPPIIKEGLYGCQISAIRGLEESLSDFRPRSLIQMATGSGKTFAAITAIYRLIKFAKAKRVLFLVDRNNLGRQAKREFMSYRTPDDGRLFTELYNVQHLTSNVLDPVNRVCITTIQRLFSMLKGEAELPEEFDEKSGFEVAPTDGRAVEVQYNRNIPIGYFDFIITDECHRSIYNLWRQVLEYFDASLIGLTATPSKQTLGYFKQNLVTEYSHERAVADGINVGYEVYRIKTEISEKGSTIEAGYYVDKRDKVTREVRWEKLDEDQEYTASQLDRDVVSKDQIRTIIKTFRDKVLTEIFPGRTEVPKTLIFAKDDSHAEDIVEIIREEFGKGNEFCKKITYRTTGEKPEDLIASFRNSFNPRIVVTVDMISTGTDIRPLECLIFMRDVRSRTYFDQMKGRGTRIISKTDLNAVTPDANSKTHFVIVDAVGVCESDKTDTRPLERKRTVPFEKLLTSIAFGNRDNDSITSLAGRLARLDQSIDVDDKQKLTDIANGTSLNQVINDLLDSVDPDRHIETARSEFGTDQPTDEQTKQAAEKLVNAAYIPFDNPDYRNLLIDLKKKSEQTIDTVSQDAVTFAGYDETARKKAESVVISFKQFIEENRDEITALQIIYSRPYGDTKLTVDAIKDLAQSLTKPPYSITPEIVWQAFDRLERSKVRGAGARRLLTDLVSLVRYASGQDDILEPFTDIVDHRFQSWLNEQKIQGVAFTEEQLVWLVMIKDHIGTSASVSKDDFELPPFAQHGGLYRVHAVFGDELDRVVDELSTVLVA